MIATFPYNLDYQPPAPVIEVVVQSRQAVTITALLDTGADASIFPIDILRKSGAPYLETRQMRSVTGHVQVVNLYLVEIQINIQRIAGIRAVAAKPGTEAIIGRDVLNQFIITLDGIGGITEIS